MPTHPFPGLSLLVALRITPLISTTCTLLYARDQDFFLRLFNHPASHRAKSRPFLPSYWQAFFRRGIYLVVGCLGATFWSSLANLYVRRPMLHAKGRLGVTIVGEVTAAKFIPRTHSSLIVRHSPFILLRALLPILTLRRSQRPNMQVHITSPLRRPRGKEVMILPQRPSLTNIPDGRMGDVLTLAAQCQPFEEKSRGARRESGLLSTRTLHVAAQGGAVGKVGVHPAGEDAEFYRKPGGDLVVWGEGVEGRGRSSGRSGTCRG
ncbi:hypothetical protein CHGG_00298 [Chaetomium globosum CBS 148.51]|uniref:Uncharacterized protein n=1 Tax=Chaetomium globosum (strain ATCC 6205 / CBS 148.51 / DSM 1962 / NBRC 6347 / NRRL 1970) TaxID=306901 RepID=Q2HHK6_CHAGB|nr:uncharacterized protein CHGG_00298 [Chaetomium globosum CBS 148.51]EAQ92063.1 hypothetical protein CHGG_00298 [Chaetomium globosum CBS 148.51]